MNAAAAAAPLITALTNDARSAAHALNSADTAIALLRTISSKAAYASRGLKAAAEGRPLRQAGTLARGELRELIRQHLHATLASSSPPTR